MAVQITGGCGMADDLNVIPLKVAVLETKTSSMEEKLDKIETKLERTYELTYQVKEQLDRQSRYIS